MKKILLLEDNALDADLVCRELKRKWPNVEINIARKLEDARKLFLNDTIFDVAIFDLKLPDGNGMDLLSELRGKKFTTPIIVFTSVGTEEIATIALKAGANDYISKKPGYHKQIPEQIEFTLKHTQENGKHLNVLYVEHHKADIDLTNLYLKKYAPHIHITPISNGDTALTMLPKTTNFSVEYDVVLLDYKLSGLNALEIIKVIRQERKLIIPIVVVTGQGNESIAVEALKIGANDYVVKQDNYLLHLPSILMNVYQKKELERQKQALKQSETKFRLLADFTSDWEYWITPDKEYIYNSPICKQTTGYQHKDFLKNKNLLTEITHPYFKEIVSNHFALKKESIHKPIEFKIITANGNEKWISHICRAVFDDDGTYLGRRGVNRDITNQKRAESIQNIILNISNASNKGLEMGKIMKLVQNELGRVVDTTNFFMAEYNEEDDTINLPYFKDQFDNITQFPAKKTFTGMVIKQKKSFLLNEIEMKNLEDNGTIEIIGEKCKLWLGVPLKTNNKVTGAFVVQSYNDANAYSKNDQEVLEIISHQISISLERKLHEEQILKALEKAEESDRLKSAFLANMSHEIRTPMSGILGFSELLKQPNLSIENQQKYLSIINKSGNRMLDTINDIMDISKIESGQMTVSFSEFNINTKVEELYSFFKPEAEKKGLEFLFNQKLAIKNAIIKSDGNKIYSILLNLIKNAIKFTLNGTIEFGYTIKGKNIEFFVNDTGIGIPENRQSFIFDRFVQADIEDKAAFEGSGLGLAISKSYVEMLKGKIWLRSEEGKGSQFYFTIPL